MKKQTWQQWARACARDSSSPSELRRGALGIQGRSSFAALTGQDARVLSAFVACLELYSNSDEDGERGALSAMRALLPAMQMSTRWIARELIPFVLEWNDRERLWPLISLPTPDLCGHPDGRFADHTAASDNDVGLRNPLGRAHP